MHLKCVSTRAPGSRITCHLTDYMENWPNSKNKVISVLDFSGGEVDHPTRFFLVFTKEIASKEGKMYETLTGIQQITLRVCTHIITSLVNVRH